MICINDSRRHDLNQVIYNLETQKEQIISIMSAEKNSARNIPYNLQDSEFADKFDDAIENLSDAIDHISESIDCLNEAKI